MWKLNVTYGITTHTSHTAVRLVDTGAAVSLIYTSLLLFTKQTRIERNLLPKMRTATRQPLRLNGLIFLHLLLRDLHTRVWFGLNPHLAADILLRTAFIYRFKHGIVHSERKKVPWLPPPIAIFTWTLKRETAQDIRTNFHIKRDKTHLNRKTHKQPPLFVLPCRKSWSQTHTIAYFVTVRSSGLVIIEPDLPPTALQPSPQLGELWTFLPVDHCTYLHICR